MLNRSLANLKSCFLIVLDDSNSSLALNLLESLRPLNDAIYLFCKVDSLTFSEAFLFVASRKKAKYLKSASSSLTVSGGAIYLCDASSLRTHNFKFSQHHIEISSDDDANSPLYNKDHSLLDVALDTWGHAASLVLLPSNNSTLIGIARYARTCNAQILPIEAQYSLFGPDFPDAVLTASGKQRVSIDTALRHCNKETDFMLARQKQNMEFDIPEERLDLSLFNDDFLNRVCALHKEEFGFSRVDDLHVAIESSDVLRRLAMQRICEALREYSSDLSTLSKLVKELFAHWLSSAGPTGPALRVWILNTFNEEQPFLLYDGMLEAMNDVGGGAVSHLTLFATNPIKHIRRPRVDLSHIGTLKVESQSASVAKYPPLNWYNRRYSTNVILAKHIPGINPNYPRLDCVLTNGLLLTLDEQKALNFIDGIKKCLNPHGIVATTPDELQKFGFDKQLNAVSLVAPQFGDSNAAQFHRVHRAKGQDRPIWS